MKKQKNIMCRMLSGMVALTLAASALAGCGNHEEETVSSSISTSLPEITEPTASVSPTLPTETVEPTHAATTYPAATVPTATTAETAPEILPMPEGGRKIPAFAEIESKLMSLDNTLRGYGPGVRYDRNMRPLGAIEEEDLFKQYGSHYIFDDNVYLTFDEGYENGYTETILDVLKEKNVKAVFFITLPYAMEEPELVNRMIREGHIIGNHSTKHLSFPTMDLHDAYNDILKVHRYVETHYGYSMKFFRFPMGESSPRMQALLQEMGYEPVFWSFAHNDWSPENQPDPETAYHKIVDLAHPGALYLLHAVSKTNTELLPYIIDAIREKGFTIAPFPVS